MTVILPDTEGLVQALHMLARDIAAGRVAGCSLHYEPTISRLSVSYITASEHDIPDGDLPELPGVGPVETDPDSEATKT